MEESNVIKALFSLLRSGLWNKAIDDLDCFPLTNSEWDYLYKIAIAQTVDSLIYDGIQFLPFDLFPPRHLMLNWIVRVDSIESINTKMNACVDKQVQFFKKLNVHPILLKGQGIGHFYPNKLHRICGDIDWYFDNINESKEVEKVLKANNIKIYSATTGSCNYLWKNFDVEHHTKLFDVFNPLARIKLSNIKKEQLHTLPDNECNSVSYAVLPPGLNIVQVNLHILKHLLSFGIGLRQFCDSAILYASLDKKYDKNWLLKLYKDIGIIKWIHVLHDLLVKYIGLSKKYLPFSLKKNVSSDWMLEDVLSTGNFGFYDDQHTIIKDDKSVKRKNKSKRLWYSFNRYFPLAPYEAMCFPFVHFFERFRSLTIG